jgi:hypothetical protein
MANLTPASSAPAPKVHNRWFRPRSRSRLRLFSGVALAVAAVVINLAVYRRLDERVPVLQITRDVPAGAQLNESDLRQVQASTSGDINVIRGSELTSIIGATARVRLIAGSLLVTQQLQSRPLVATGSSVLALTFPAGELPAGLRERSNVVLVLIAGQGSTATSATVPARVSTLPAAVGGQGDRLGLSFEMAAASAPAVAAAERVRVVLVDPGSDPVYDPPATAGPAVTVVAPGG